ncbi:hypothetical protein FHR56_003447 [Xanthomonas sacchari]|uniref:ORC-CDC6 family AAA ATPase n=1 Tax=unclassified Xanthomonas TaxID=2643310 RepID=UPI001368748E|nr:MULTISPECIES: hypothetical protein [unclassified Xanthomonas]MBB6368268.1 hypothetical protein [Xanthomonas sp. F10]MXV32174.1 hypothetical protein [Xanthomonas sp. LMG 8989]
MTTRFPDAFLTVRSEEGNIDKWGDFIVPPFIHTLGIKAQTKAFVIVGGRGCGKTTLLRYFCHPTQFSPRRSDLPADAFSHIGLYWRADTNFLNSFVGSEQSESRWRAAFEHVLACELGRELVGALRSINCNETRRSSYGGLEKLDLSPLDVFDAGFGNSLESADRVLARKSSELAIWLNNMEQESVPRFIPLTAFLSAFVGVIREQLGYLAKSTFVVFIDEYENMRVEQQKFINGLLKHGVPPLLFNIAMKRNGFQVKQTLGPESIEAISDYSQVDIETELMEDFELFAAELMFFRLAELRPDLASSLVVDTDQLTSVDRVYERFGDDNYRRKVVSAAEHMLPRIGEREAAELILNDPRLRARLVKNISSALEARAAKLTPEAFISEAVPWASVIMPALLSRQRESPTDLLAELRKQEGGSETRFGYGQDLIMTNLWGCINALYMDAQRTSVLFSGFGALTLMTRGNVRHFIDLVHRIFLAYEKSGKISRDLPEVEARIQMEAIREASDAILAKVKGHGKYGPQLHAMVQCLGSIFRERHRATRQSEPEINHFVLGTGELTEQLQTYLDEAEKWSVLSIARETKMKAAAMITYDYILNPVYAPFFQISFRKKRSMKLDAEQLRVMLEGDQGQRNQLVRELGRREDDVMDLFAGTN